MHEAQVGPGGPEPGGDEAQVVVLHQDGGTVGSGLGGRVGEGLVDLAVRRPRRAPAAVEAGPPSGVEETVVGEPERGVAHDVIGGAVGVGIERQQPHPQTLGHHDASVGGGPVPVGHGRRDPDRVGAVDEGGQAGHEAAGAASGDELAAVVDR